MSNEFYSLVTDYCTEKQLKCIKEGIPFDISEIALGDGSGKYYEPTAAQTKLVNEVWRGAVEQCEWINDRFYCITTVPAEVGGFIVREAGVFDNAGNLLVISKFPETYKQLPDSGTVKQLTIRIELLLSNTELTELVINPNISSVTKEELEKYQKISEKGAANGYTPLDNSGLIPKQFIPEIETKSILTPFCLNSCKLDSKGNPDLLSCETVKVQKFTAANLGIFYVPLDFVFEKDGIVYSDTELSVEKGKIVAVDTENLSIAFGVIETLSEDEENALHYSGSTTGDFYIKESLTLGAECFSDSDCTNSIGVVTYLNLTKIAIGQNETYSKDSDITTHIYITAHAPFTYTTASSKTYNVEEDLVLDVVDLCPESGTQNFNLFVNSEDGIFTLVALPNQIFTQMLEPTDYTANDVWFKILEPLASYIYLLNIWQETNLVPVGVFTLEG